MTTSNNSLLKFVLVSTAIFLLFIPRNIGAADVCYDNQYFPFVTRLAETIAGIEVDLSGAYSENCEGPTAEVVVPIIILQNNRWKHLGKRKNVRCDTPNETSCPIKIPAWPTISPKEFCKNALDYKDFKDYENYQFCIANAYNGEEPSSCTVIKESVWFGINFYQGEGSYGYGGLGHYNRKSNIVKVRRIPELKEYPTHKVVWDGKHIWAATTNNWECIGSPPALGLVKYDWENRILTIFKGKETGPCGFIINDLLWSNDSLWVATDIGFSRWNAKEDKWTHYLPDLKPPYTVREDSCDAFYKLMLNSLTKEKKYVTGAPYESPYSFLYNYLKEFRPDFIKRYEAK